MSLRTDLPRTGPIVTKRKTEADQVNPAKTARSYNTLIVKSHYARFEVTFRYLMEVEGNGFSDTVIKLINQYNQFANNTNHRVMAEQINQFLGEFNALDMQTIIGKNNNLAIRILKMLVEDIVEIKLFEHTTMTAATEVGRLQRRGRFVDSICRSLSEISASMATDAAEMFKFNDFVTRYHNLRKNNARMLRAAIKHAPEAPVENNIAQDNSNVDTNHPVRSAVVIDEPVAPPVIAVAQIPEPVVTAEAVQQLGVNFQQLRVQHKQLEAVRNTLARQARAITAMVEQKTAEDHASNTIALQTLQAQRQKAKMMNLENLLSPEELNSIPGIDVVDQAVNPQGQVDQLAIDLREQENTQLKLLAEIDVRIAECETAAKRLQDYLSQSNSHLDAFSLPGDVIEKIEAKRKSINPATLFANIQTGSELPALQRLVKTCEQLKQQSEESARRLAEKNGSIVAKTQALQRKNQRFQGLFSDYVQQVDELERALQVTQPMLEQERPASPSLGGSCHE